MRNKKTCDCWSHSSLLWHSVLSFHHRHEFANRHWQEWETTENCDFGGRCLPRADRRLLWVHRPLPPARTLPAQGLLGDTSPRQHLSSITWPQHLESNMHECNHENECLVCRLEGVRGAGPQGKVLTLSSVLASSALIYPSLSQRPRLSSYILRMQSSFSLLKTF